MKAATIMSLAAAAAAAPTISQPRAEVKTFGGMALRSASDIHFAQVNANGQQFWLNKQTSTYCPSTAVDCTNYNGTSTTFVGGDNTLSLSTTVPGGQQVYVSPNGLLKFTQAHSANIEPGSSTSGFSIDEAGNLLFQGESWYACNLGEAYDNAYSIYAASGASGEAFNTACQGFSFRTVEGGNAGPVWQYV